MTGGQIIAMVLVVLLIVGALAGLIYWGVVKSKSNSTSDSSVSTLTTNKGTRTTTIVNGKTTTTWVPNQE